LRSASISLFSLWPNVVDEHSEGEPSPAERSPFPRRWVRRALPGAIGNASKEKTSRENLDLAPFYSFVTLEVCLREEPDQAEEQEEETQEQSACPSLVLR
jgi:hypothetical protein